MKRKIILLGVLVTLTLTLQAQSSRVDSIALIILKRSSATIGDLRSFSFQVNSEFDLSSDEVGLIKHSQEQRAHIRKPDKMAVVSSGDEGRRSLWYNGKQLSFYSFDSNHYSQIAAPATVLEMIDVVNKTYGIEFPAADFFYPSFVNDLLDASYNLVYLGLTQVNGKPCFHIAGTAADMTFQFWINNDEFFLPSKIVIVYTHREGTPQYEAVFTDWKLNPDLPLSMFEFAPPPKAEKIALLAKSEKK